MRSTRSRVRWRMLRQRIRETGLPEKDPLFGSAGHLADIIFIETSVFTEQSSGGLFGDNELRNLQADLIKDPTSGDLIKGGHGLRKKTLVNLITPRITQWTKNYSKNSNRASSK